MNPCPPPAFAAPPSRGVTALKHNESERDREFGGTCFSKMAEYFFAVGRPKLVTEGRGGEGRRSNGGGGGEGNNKSRFLAGRPAGRHSNSSHLIPRGGRGRKATGFVAALCLGFFWPVIKSYVIRGQKEDGRQTG